MRLTVLWLNPHRVAMARVLQCVAARGVASSVSVTICSTWASLMRRGAPGRGSSSNPSSRAATNRLRHLPTVCLVRRSSRDVCAVEDVVVRCHGLLRRLAGSVDVPIVACSITERTSPGRTWESRASRSLLPYDFAAHEFDELQCYLRRYSQWSESILPFGVNFPMRTALRSGRI